MFGKYIAGQFVGSLPARIREARFRACILLVQMALVRVYSVALARSIASSTVSQIVIPKTIIHHVTT